MIHRVLLSFIVVALLWGPVFAAEEIKIGSINDLTGGTADVGKDTYLGIRECETYINDQGGINGKKIKIYRQDYGYKPNQAEMLYKTFRDSYKISLLLQWGTADTEALSQTVAKDKMVAISDSFSAKLCDPKVAPYNFIYGTDYSTNARAALTVWYEEIWKKSDKWKKERDAGEKPKLVCFYARNIPYANAPIQAIKDQAKLLGIEVGSDQDVDLRALEATSQALSAAKENPSIIWHGNTTMSVATAIKACKDNNLKADHITNNWGFDKNLLKLTREKGEGTIGLAACGFLEENVPLMDKVREYCQKVHPDEPMEKRDIRTVQGWVKVAMAAAALQIADKKGSLKGPDIKAALETFKDWSPFNTPNALGRPPVTFTDSDHRPSSVSLLYVIKNGKIEFLSKIDMKEKYADKWQSWLGW